MRVDAHAEATIHVAPETVFAALTDVTRLPEWNERMTRVVETPVTLAPGAEWVVEFRVFGHTWRSRSTVDELDAAARRFVHRSRTDDGNPSSAQWAWTVLEHPSGSRVRVEWSLHPVTFWRRTLLVRMRARQLARRELPASLAALSRLLDRPSSPAVERPDT